jgi:hypothetical protein
MTHHNAPEELLLRDRETESARNERDVHVPVLLHTMNGSASRRRREQRNSLPARTNHRVDRSVPSHEQGL